MGKAIFIRFYGIDGHAVIVIEHQVRIAGLQVQNNRAFAANFTHIGDHDLDVRHFRVTHMSHQGIVDTRLNRFAS